MKGSLLVCLAIGGAAWLAPLAAVAQAAVEGSGMSVVAETDPQTSDVTLANAQIRLRFTYGKPQFKLFPVGYTGYVLEVRDGGVLLGLEGQTRFLRVGQTLP